MTRSLAFCFCLALPARLLGQGQAGPPVYVELHAAVFSGFGPGDGQAEIVGGLGNSFDGTRHFRPGFQDAHAPEFVVGYRRRGLRLQGTVASFSQDIGLVEAPAFSSDGPPLAVAEMLSVKVSILGHGQPNPDGFFAGGFVAATFPLSYRMNEQAKSDFGLARVHAAGTQFGWGVELSYSMPLGHHGLYAVAGASVPMPGLGGSVGTIEAQQGSAYTIVRDQIRVYEFRGFLGGGYRFGKG